jgi:hypothetical protein
MSTISLYFPMPFRATKGTGRRPGASRADAEPRYKVAAACAGIAATGCKPLGSPGQEASVQGIKKIGKGDKNVYDLRTSKKQKRAASQKGAFR